MNFTQHLLKRCRQRGINISTIELIRSLGTEVRKPGGVHEYFVSQQTKQEIIKLLKKCIQEIDRLAGKSIIVNEVSGDVITAYHKTR
jgi:S-adenosylmethionine:tRNA-ribosyltransferase-isomerase (queuine synthetase)